MLGYDWHAGCQGGSPARRRSLRKVFPETMGTNQGLLPSPEHAPSVPADATPQQRIAIWLDLLHTGHKLLLAGFRREVGPNGDVQEAYRNWYAQQMDEHDRTVARMLERMKRTKHAT